MWGGWRMKIYFQKSQCSHCMVLQSSQFSQRCVSTELVDIWQKETGLQRHNDKEKNHPSICPSVSLYVSFLPLSIAPVDPCALSFSSVFTPTCSHSLVPPSSLFHLPSATEAAAVWTAEERWDCCSAWTGLNNYHPSFCVPTNEYLYICCYVRQFYFICLLSSVVVVRICQNKTESNLFDMFRQ